MTEQTDGDMTGRDPVSSTAEGDDDPGTAALAGAGTGRGAVADGGDDEAEGRKFADVPTPPEADDDTPVTDAAPETHMGDPEP